MRKMTHVFAAMTAAVLLAVPNACCVFAAKETVGSAPQVELGMSGEGAITEAEADGLVPVLEIHLPEEPEEQATSDALEENSGAGSAPGFAVSDFAAGRVILASVADPDSGFDCCTDCPPAGRQKGLMEKAALGRFFCAEHLNMKKI